MSRPSDEPSEEDLKAKLQAASRRYARAKTVLMQHVGSPSGPEYLAKVEAWRRAVGALARAALKYARVNEETEVEEETA